MKLLTKGVVRVVLYNNPLWENTSSHNCSDDVLRTVAKAASEARVYYRVYAMSAQLRGLLERKRVSVLRGRRRQRGRKAVLGRRRESKSTTVPGEPCHDKTCHSSDLSEFDHVETADLY